MKIKEVIKFDHLVLTGISGYTFGTVLSMKTGIPTCLVRKPGDNSHGREVEGLGKMDTYMILDDLISTGGTIRTTIKSLDKQPKYGKAGFIVRDMPPKCVGILLYGERIHKDRVWFDFEEGRIPIFLLNRLTIDIHGVKSTVQRR